MARKKQQATPAWSDTSRELARILSITTYPDTRCIGLTKKNQKCTKPIASSNVELLPEKLQEVAAEGSVTRQTREQLEEIAKLALCAQFHRNQALAKATDWIALLEAYGRGRKTHLMAAGTGDKAKSQEHGTCNKTQACASDKKPNTVYKKSESQPGSPVKQSPDPRAKRQDTPSTPSNADSHRVGSHPPSAPGPSTGRTTRVSRQTRCGTEELPTDQSQSNAGHSFQLFSARLVVSKANEMVKRKLAQPLKGEDFKPGYVYGYTLPGAKEKSELEISKGREGSIMVKIGYSADPNQRMNRIRYTCGYEPAVLVSVDTTHARRYEQIIHSFLHNIRYHESLGCPQCSTCHKEWFKAEQAEDAAWVIEMWRDWAHREPYDAQGHLKPEWRTRLDQIDVKDPRCWERFIYGRYIRRTTVVGAGGAVVSAKPQLIVKKEEQDD